jgi:RNA polymerase sigma factor (sigma-70 family)
LRLRRKASWQELDQEFARAKNGNEESRDKVLSFLRSKLLSLARYRVAEAAEDTVQETLIIVYNRFPEFDALEGLKAFSHQVLRNKIGNIYQERSRQKRVELDDADLHYEINEDLEAGELDRIVCESIDKLGERHPTCREILSRLYEGLDPGEISEQLGISKSRLKVRTFRCREALREILSKQYRVVL